MDEAFVMAGGIRTGYLRAGQGPPLLLLHGIHGRADHWRWVVPTLAERFTCYALELVGHGRTERPPLPYRLDDYARHVLGFMDAVGVERASLVGSSLGGAIALRLGATASERVDRLVVACPAGLGSASVSEVFRFLAGLLETTLGIRTRALAAWSERNQFENRKNVDPWFFFSKAEDATKRRRDPVLRRVTLRQAFGLASLGPVDTAAVKQPTLVVSGTADWSLPWENTLDAVSRFPDARLRVFTACGHLPHVECPDRFAEAALEHLGATGAPPRTADRPHTRSGNRTTGTDPRESVRTPPTPSG